MPESEMTSEFCCDDMRRQIQFTCPDHAGPFECPDALVVRVKATGEYGIVVRDGPDGSGSSYVVIDYCPWCGKTLGGLKP
jgi:hypothetical protein